MITVGSEIVYPGAEVVSETVIGPLDVVIALVCMIVDPPRVVVEDCVVPTALVKNPWDDGDEATDIQLQSLGSKEDGQEAFGMHELMVYLVEVGIFYDTIL